MTDPVIFQKSPMLIEVEEGKTYFWCALAKAPLCKAGQFSFERLPDFLLPAFCE